LHPRKPKWIKGHGLAFPSTRSNAYQKNYVTPNASERFGNYSGAYPACANVVGIGQHAGSTRRSAGFGRDGGIFSGSLAMVFSNAQEL
jgi:hypothetical protein